MGRATPKIVMLIAIAGVVGAIFYVTRDWGAPKNQPGVVYIDQGIGAK
jgi:hypothetical protein